MQSNGDTHPKTIVEIAKEVVEKYRARLHLGMPVGNACKLAQGVIEMDAEIKRLQSKNDILLDNTSKLIRKQSQALRAARQLLLDTDEHDWLKWRNEWLDKYSPLCGEEIP